MPVDPRKSNAMCLPDHAAGAEDCIPSGSVTPARMSEVLRRLGSDHYNSAEVRDAMARGVLQDLDLSRTTSFDRHTPADGTA